jgi:hypothetical protein
MAINSGATPGDSMDELTKEAAELQKRWLANSEFAEDIRVKQFPSLRNDTLKLLGRLPL